MYGAGIHNYHQKKRMRKEQTEALHPCVSVQYEFASYLVSLVSRVFKTFVLHLNSEHVFSLVVSPHCSCQFSSVCGWDQTPPRSPAVAAAAADGAWLSLLHTWDLLTATYEAIWTNESGGEGANIKAKWGGEEKSKNVFTVFLHVIVVGAKASWLKEARVPD